MTGLRTILGTVAGKTQPQPPQMPRADLEQAYAQALAEIARLRGINRDLSQERAAYERFCAHWHVWRPNAGGEHQ